MKAPIKHKRFYLWATVLLCLFSSCAKQAALVGGEKDILPPAILKQKPENYSTRYPVDAKGKRIEVYFDEFVQLNNPSETFQVSPPMKRPPEYSLKGKALIVDIKDTLQENTTYIITCNEGIKDLTEGNMLPLTSFVFSTGDYVDSLSFAGNVKDAFTLSPTEKMAVLLFKENEDSTLLKDQFYYYTATDKDGRFRFSNLAAGKYHLCALNDKNRNYIFDQSDEAVAFFVDWIEPEYFPVPAEKDTLSPADTVSVQDSSSIFKIDYEKYTLRMFEEQDTSLRFLRREFKSNYRHDFIFKGEVEDFRLNQISHLDTIITCLTRYNKTKDTISVYLTSLTNNQIEFELFANGRLLDTLAFNPSQKGSSGGGRRGGRSRAADTAKVYLTCNVLTKGELHKDVCIEFLYPVEKYDFSACRIAEHLKNKSDTSLVTCYFADSLKMQLAFSYPFKEKTKYEIFFPDSVFFSYLGYCNDSLKIDFTTKSQREYGALQVSYQFSEQNHYIVQLLDDKSVIVQEDSLSSDKTLTYTYLTPGKYRIRVIEDANNNNKWD
ncbi:MAG: Ig-like domain-containing protein, partial [Bacteroidales bacterium]|nr:Ig-like domain-containing protein [Bacteroidales bacterium]